MTLLAELRAIVSDAAVLTDSDLSAWEVDWRKRSRGRALAVVRRAVRGLDNAGSAARMHRST